MVCVCGQHPQQTEEERPVAKFEATIAWSGRLEIILHFACIVVVCIALLIPAGIALETISEIEEYIDSNGGTLTPVQNYSIVRYADRTYSTDGKFDADGSRRAAGWLVFVCSAGIVFHVVGILIRICYLITGVKKHMILYSVMVTIVSIIFTFCILTGAVANGLQVLSNSSLQSDRCLFELEDSKVCQDLGTLINCHLVCTILFPVSMVMYGIMLCPVIYGASTLKRHNNENRGSCASQSRSRPTTQSALTQSVSSNTPTNEQPFISENVSPSSSKSPPPYESTLMEPPSYKVAITSTDV